MKNKYTSKDWQLLSAYLDGQLTSPQKEKLEARLHLEPGLQEAFLSLQQTKMLLKHARQIKISAQLHAYPRTGRKAQASTQFPLAASALAIISSGNRYDGSCHSDGNGCQPCCPAAHSRSPFQ